METNYKRTVAGSVGAGIGAILNASGRQYYILEHKTETKYHHVGESQKIIIDQIELGRDSSCQVRFDEGCETVSRRHAAIMKEGDRYKLIPLSQTNNTIVNGQPINGEWYLNSGDEIRLSSRGPVLGFIIPQGNQSLVKSIGLTERMNLFRKQALRPYKTGIILLAILLVLAVGALVGWNIYQSRQYEQQLQEKSAQISQVQNQIDEKANEIAGLEQQLAASGDKSESQIKSLQGALANARKERAALIDQQTALKDEIAEIREKANEEPTYEPEPDDIYADAVIEDQDISDCYNAVYYIKMNDIVVFDNENKERARFNTDGYVGGTGFLLDNGRFITARRVAEPWFYYRSDIIGKDIHGYAWTYDDLEAVVLNLGWKVIADYTAYSPSGVNFKFKTTDLRGVQNINKEKYSYTTKYVVNRKNKMIYKLFKTDTIELVKYDRHAKTDWASMAKAEQLNNIKGLKVNKQYSLSPVAPMEVAILGYPFVAGFDNSESVRPVYYQNNINVSGLNDLGVIELASRRYQIGYDGAPVLVKMDGQWNVIGILSHTDSADRDEVVPIADAN